MNTFFAYAMVTWASASLFVLSGAAFLYGIELYSRFFGVWKAIRDPYAEGLRIGREIGRKDMQELEDTP